MTTPSSPPDRRIRTPWLAARRALFLVLTGGTTVAATLLMAGIVGAAGVTALELGFLALFVPTFAWISIAFWNAVLGFLLGMLRLDPLTLTRSRSLAPTVDGHPDAAASRDEGTESLQHRTALVMPAHNEDPERVMDGLRAMLDSLDETGLAHRFDVHLLSDTTDDRVAAEERAAWKALCSGRADADRLHYRRRARNTGRKAGNIGEFCARRGDDYRYMVVLDADSVMDGPTLVELVRTMDANPRAGIVQTVPIPARQRTIFGRFVQFAATLYSPMLAAGQSFWQGDSANYWGHNAIIRLAPFVEHGRLPLLPGSPPLGGPVLSHDFVEAALVRRGGWGVYLMPWLGGSYEEVPGNVIDFAKRDRRWAQGSLQHLRLLGLPGLHPISRVHFVLGAMGYLSSVLWLLMLLASTAYVLVPAASGWIVRGPVGPGVGGLQVLGVSGLDAIPLLAMTGAVLFLPKLLGTLLAVVDRRPDFGGGLRLTASAVLEAVFSVIIAPLMMLFHTRFVLEIVAGRDAAWGSQHRDGRRVGWAEAWHETRGIVFAGVVWAGATLWWSPIFFLWLTPIFAGIVTATLLVRGTSSTPAGARFRSLGLLLTPGEIAGRRTPLDRGAPEPSPEPRDERGEYSRRSFRSGKHPSDAGRTPAGAMYDAERGLFDLQRGRPICIVPGNGSGREATMLLAAVEGLDAPTLDRLRRLGDGEIRLLITDHRARAMGLGQPTVGPTLEGPGDAALTSPRRGLSIALNGESPDELVRLASARDLLANERESRDVDGAEASGLTLTRLARLLPAAVGVRVPPERFGEVRALIESGAVLEVGSDQIENLAGHGDTNVEVTFVSEAPVPIEQAENVRFMLFREGNGLTEHVAILVGDRSTWPDPVPVRLHSACLTGDLFGSLRCDCGEQLRRSLSLFAEQDGGVLLYLEQEGRGIGLGNKLRAYSLQQQGLDTVDADCVLGFGSDERRYHAAVGILRHLQVDRVRLLTNNPLKLAALEEAGITVVDRTPLHGTLNRHNLPYVRAKVQRAGHWLGDMLRGGPESAPPKWNGKRKSPAEEVGGD